MQIPLLRRKSTRLLLDIILFLGLSLQGLHAQDLIPEPPVLNARSAVLYDLATGTLLYEKNSREEIPPASLTKLMSLHLAYKAVDQGKLKLDQLIPIGPDASFKNSPPQSSLMFLEEGQRVSLLDLMIGLAIPSGNDAGIALARAVSGGLEFFVEEMNREARRLGLNQTRFTDSFGYSEENMTTAEDFARFCMIYLEQHPQAPAQLHSLTEYTYPREENMVPSGTSTHGSITQYNRNSLVSRLDGVDGLKTGYIDESGYNLAVTAERRGRRLLAVLLGGTDIGPRDGSLVRTIDAAALLTYGFTAFTQFIPDLPRLPAARVWKAREKYVRLETAPLPLMTLDRVRAAGIQWDIRLDRVIRAPFEKGTAAGTLTARDFRGELLIQQPLVTQTGAPRGSWARRLLDSIRLFFLKG